MRAQCEECYYSAENLIISPKVGRMIFRHGVKLDPWKLKALTEMPFKYKKELEAFLWILNYLNKFSPRMTHVWD